MACDLSTIQSAVCTSGIGKEQSKIKLLQLIAQLTCEAGEGGSGGGSQTPWLSNIDGGGFDLSNVDNISATTFSGALTGNVTGASSLNVLKAGDTMTGLLTIAQATANTSAFVSTGYSLTGANAQSLLSLAGTWNTSGAPTAIDLNITNTTSAATSFLMNLRVGGTSRFGILVDGAALFMNTVRMVVLTGRLSSRNTAATAYAPFDTAGSYLVYDATSDTSALALDAAITAARITFNRGDTGIIQTASGGQFRWGSTTGNQRTEAPDSGFSRNAAGIVEVNNGTAGTFRDLWARHLRLATAFTVATLPAAGVAGRMSYVTDALAPAFLTIVAGGGAIVTPVFDNGTNWVSV